MLAAAERSRNTLEGGKRNAATGELKKGKSSVFSNLNATQKGLILILVPVFLEVVFVLILGCIVNSTASNLDQLEHQNDALVNLHKFEFSMSESALSLITQHEKDDELALSNIRRLKHFLSNQGDHSIFAMNRFPELRSLAVQMKDLRNATLHVLDKIESVALDPSIPWSDRPKYVSRQEMIAILMQGSDLSREIVAIETRAGKKGPKEISDTQRMLQVFLVLGVALNAALSLFLARWFSDRMKSRLDTVAENARRIAVGEKLELSPGGRDEIAAVERVLYVSSLILEDIHRKEKAMIDNAADIICSLDAKLRFIGVSKAAARIWDFTDDELLGRSVLTIVHPSAMEATREQLIETKEQRQKTELENIVVRGDGRQMTAVWRINWSDDDRAFYCVVHDVSELRAVERLKQQFLAIVSHDLRAPLTSVGLSLSMLLEDRKGPLTDAVRKQLERAQRSLTRLVDLVNELLELEKFGSGRMQIDRHDMSAADACRAAIDSLENLARTANVKLAAPRSDAPLCADERRVVQAIVNLLSNAIKFSPAGTTISLEVSNIGDDVVFAVKDEGPGIPAEQRNLIFEKFHQTDARSNIGVKGTGLGLAIVKAIAQAHGGTVGLSSELGKGSTFWIRVPSLIEQAEEAHA